MELFPWSGQNLELDDFSYMYVNEVLGRRIAFRFTLPVDNSPGKA